MNKFKELGLSDITIDAITKKGFTIPTPIQEKTIPILLEGKHDVIAKAQTGTGKTACFALPILENLIQTKNVQAIILVPTRELAIQVATEIRSLVGSRKVKITSIYGGASMRDQMDDLKRGVDIVVGTPGRVMDLMERKVLDISKVSYAVLDEADEMLNMGFVEDIEEILKKTNTDKKMLLFSATMPKEIQRIAKKFMREHELVSIENETLATQLIEQTYINIAAKDRYSAIRRIIAFTPGFHGLIFCKTKAEVDQLSNKLSKDQYSTAALHGDISQGQRESILRQFKDKKLNVLIATDVAARGIDVNDLNIVINFSLPQSPDVYVHRIGRTGRAGNKGKAITFLIPSETKKLKFVERIINQKITKGNLPSIDDIIASKKKNVESKIKDILESVRDNEYDQIAKNLLKEHDAEKIISSVLKYAFANELDHNSYKEIQESSHEDYSEIKSSQRSDRGFRSRNDSGRSRFQSRDRERSPKSWERKDSGNREITQNRWSPKRNSPRSEGGFAKRKENKPWEDKFKK